MNVDSIVTDAVVAGLPEDEARQYKALIAKPSDLLTDEDRKFLSEKEVKALQKSMGMSLLTRGEPLGCTCNAGLSTHRQGCPLYGQPSGASDFMRLMRGRS